MWSYQKIFGCLSKSVGGHFLCLLHGFYVKINLFEEYFIKKQFFCQLKVIVLIYTR